MADGSQSIEPKNTRTQREMADDASDGLCRALALADVMCMLANTGEVESLNKHSLSTSLMMLCDILQDSKGLVDSIDASLAGLKPEVPANGATDKAVAERLDKQYHPILQVSASIQTAMKAIDSLDNDGQNTHLVALWSSFDLIQDTLEDIAEHIQPCMVLKQGVAS